MKTKQTLTLGLAALTLTLGAPFTTGAFAQTTTTHKNIVQKHPNATGVAAGVATHTALKRSAAAKKRAHKKLNFAERHPTLTGIAAGVATSKVIKKTTHSATKTTSPSHKTP
jgi:hypothetical protein